MENWPGISKSLRQSPKKEKKKRNYAGENGEGRGVWGGAKSCKIKKRPSASWVQDERFTSRHQRN